MNVKNRERKVLTSDTKTEEGEIESKRKLISNAHRGKLCFQHSRTEEKSEEYHSKLSIETP